MATLKRRHMCRPVYIRDPLPGVVDCGLNEQMTEMYMLMQWRWRALPVMGTLIAILGCDSDGVSHDGTPGQPDVFIVDNVQPQWSDRDEWRLSELPSLAIGMHDGPEAYLFESIRNVFRLPNGNIAVLDRGSSELRFFASSGTHLHSVGGKGDGPGEFRGGLQLSGIAVGDSLIILDPEANRISTFDLNGSLVKTVPVVFAQGLGGTSYRLLGAVPDGYVLRPLVGGRLSPESTTVWWDSTAILLMNGDGVVSSAGKGYSGMHWYNTPVSAGFPRWGARTSSALHNGLLYTGDGRTFEVSVFAPSGSVVLRIRKQGDPAMTGAAADAALIRWIEALARQHTSEADVSPTEYIQEPRTESLPYFDALAVDALGNLWVSSYRPQWGDIRGIWVSGPDEWDVFDQNGTWLGTVETDSGLRVHEIGTDYVLGVWEDEVGVEQVRLYELWRGRED